MSKTTPILQAYADSYAQMSRCGTGDVGAYSIKTDIERNMIPAVAKVEARLNAQIRGLEARLEDVANIEKILSDNNEQMLMFESQTLRAQHFALEVKSIAIENRIKNRQLMALFDNPVGYLIEGDMKVSVSYGIYQYSGIRVEKWEPFSEVKKFPGWRPNGGDNEWVRSVQVTPLYAVSNKQLNREPT